MFLEEEKKLNHSMNQTPASEWGEVNGAGHADC